MFNVLDITQDDLIAIQVKGEITKEDYEKLNPLIDKTVKDYGKVKFLILMGKIDAIKPEALLKDFKAYFKHFNNISKVAFVGDKSWQELVAKVASPFISGKIKYFPESQVIEAQNWVKE